MAKIPRCDLVAPTSILRANDWGHPYRLTEASPHYDGSASSMHSIIKWLGVEKGKRWQPKVGTTYCNVYATDFSHACGAYLPRVWWTPSAESALQNGITVTPVYGKTVIELSANGLFRWLAGPQSAAFGWQRSTSLDDSQTAANGGLPVVLCCRNKVESSSGHIAVLAPESSTVVAKKDANGSILLPVISQAGGRNVELGLATSWWTSPEMAEWGIWIHDPTCV